jgi:hypothetical protein
MKIPLASLERKRNGTKERELGESKMKEGHFSSCFLRPVQLSFRRALFFFSSSPAEYLPKLGPTSE